MTRGMDERRRHGWPFWFAIALLALPILYVGSFGPAWWTLDLTKRSSHGYFLRVIYRPILVAARDYPKSIGYVVDRYAAIGRKDRLTIHLQKDGIEMRFEPPAM